MKRMKQMSLGRTAREFFAFALLLAVVASLPVTAACQSRDEWQRPAEVMDALGLKAGSAVADVGAGGGYFTFHLAERVGPEGRVYAVDIDDGDLGRIRLRAEREGLAQIEIIHSKTDDPSLPAESVDAILVVNAYHEFREYDAMMKGMALALKPKGLLAIIDSPTDHSDSRSPYYSRHRIPEEVVQEDAERNGLRFARKERGFTRPGRRGGKEYYFLIFEKPETSVAP